MLVKTLVWRCQRCQGIKTQLLPVNNSGCSAYFKNTAYQPHRIYFVPSISPFASLMKMWDSAVGSFLTRSDIFPPWSQFQAKQEGDDILKCVSTSLDHASALNSMKSGTNFDRGIKQYQGWWSAIRSYHSHQQLLFRFEIKPTIWSGPYMILILKWSASPASLTTWQLCFLLSKPPRCLQHKLVPPLVFPQSLPLF